jgi:cytochrome c553
LRSAVFAAILLFAGNALAIDAGQAELCFSCHGRSGVSTTPLTPSLGGQPSFFVVAQLFLFRDNRRGNVATAMYEISRGMSDDDLRAWGEFVSKLPPPGPPASAPDPARLERARALLEREHCAACHNPDFSGREQVPRLANQREDYLVKALRDYKSGARIGYGNAAMAEAVSNLADFELLDLAHFLAFLPVGVAQTNSPR